MRRTFSSKGLPRLPAGTRVGIVYSSYYKEEAESFIAAAIRTLAGAGVRKKNVALHPAPGSFEVPLVGSALARAGAVDGLIGFGIIVEGETHHAAFLAREAARGIMEVQLRHDLPFAFEILHVDDLAQARARTSGRANKGVEAARAVVLALAELRKIRSASVVRGKRKRRMTR